MTYPIHVENNLFSTAHPHISKHISVKSVLISLLIALVGILCILFSLNLDETSSTSSMLLLTLGTIFVLTALFRFFWKSTEVIYLPTCSPIIEGSCFVDSAELENLHRMMEIMNFKQTGISFKESGNGRLDYFFSKDGKFMGAQLFRFVPYTYEPFSEIYYYTDKDASAFKNFLETHSK